MRSVSFFALLLMVIVSTNSAQAQVTSSWSAGKTANGEAIRKILQADPIHRTLPAYVNRTFRLPRPLPITYLENGKINASYSPSRHKITMSYDLGVYLYGLFKKNGSSDPAGQVRATMGFILLHEMGHALVGELALPQVGRGEDAADEFAALFGPKIVGDRGNTLAWNAAQWFRLMDKSAVDIKKLPFWDEHGLNTQRFYNILCNLYGSDPKRFSQAISPIVPYTRLRLAQQRYPKKMERWERLFSRHLVRANGKSLHRTFPLRQTPAKISLKTKKTGTLMTPVQLNRVRLIGALLARLNGTYKLPKNLTVVSQSTQLRRNHFLPITGQIVLSDSFLSDARAKLYKRYPAAQAQESYLALESFSVLQEFSKALIVDADLAITGELEDAAAELTIMTLVSDPELRKLARPMTRWFSLLSEQNVNVLKLQYWSESALDEQRYYDLLGYLYSADPQNSSFVKPLINAKRLRKMAWEYQKKRWAWGQLLKPYLR